MSEASKEASQVAGVPVLILKEGSSRESGREAQRANIMAARIVAEAVKSSLDEMDVQHPAAKMMVEVAKAQDSEVGDGTTSVVVLAGELLGKAQDLMEKNVHPTIIIEGFRKAEEKALEVLERIAVPVNPEDKEALKKVAMTSMASKLVAESRDKLAEIAASAVLRVARKVEDRYTVDLDDILVVKKAGESLADTRLIDGIVLDKEVVHPGMPKRVEKAKIALIECPLEIEKTEFDSKIFIENPEQMEAFLKEEEHMLEEMVEKIAGKGANVVLCQKGIDDVAQHFLARKGILAVRRVKKSDMERLAKATGARIITNLDDLKEDDLGCAELVEERKIGDDKMVFIEGEVQPKEL